MVGKKGLPDRIVASSPALRDAVLQWRFDPATVEGKAREAKATFDMECGECGAGVAPVRGAAGSRPKPPPVLFKIEPEYSAEARQAKFNGSVSIQLIVDQDGFPTNLRIAHPICLGLDEKALAALKQWRFNPATRDGSPVPFEATVEITFRLL